MCGAARTEGRCPRPANASACDPAAADLAPLAREVRPPPIKPQRCAGPDYAASRLREHGIGATRRNISIDADTEAAQRWLRKQGICTASRLLRDAAREELGRQGMRVWDGEVLTHGEWAARLDATIRERVAEYEGELRSESG